MKITGMSMEKKELSDAWTGFTRFVLIKKGHPKDILGPGGDFQGNKKLSS